MSVLTKPRPRSTLVAIAFASLLGFGSAAQAEIVANLGIVAAGSAEVVGCNTIECTTTSGSVGGSLPNSGSFTHQIIFEVDTAANAIAATQILNNSTIDVAAMDVHLFLWTSGGTAVGETASGNLLATAISNTFQTTTNFFLQFAGLDPANRYFIEIQGSGAGVLSSGASYSQQLSLSVAPIPLPPAILLLAAALLGLVGYARLRRRAPAA